MRTQEINQITQMMATMMMMGMGAGMVKPIMLQNEKSASETQATYALLKSACQELDDLTQRVDIAHNTMNRLEVLIKPHATMEEYLDISNLSRGLNWVMNDCVKAKRAIRSILSRGLIKKP